MTNGTFNAPDALEWGHGSKGLEIFLEPTCPYSGRAFNKLEALLSRAGEDKLTMSSGDGIDAWLNKLGFA